jgi:RNA polymerase sigma-70 factor (ECF subfamily)
MSALKRYGIAMRKCADTIRANMRRRRFDAGVAADVSRQGASPTPEAGIDLATAIRGLPPTHRAVVHLFYREELSVGEIASALGIPAGTVKSRLHHARLALKQKAVIRSPVITTAMSGLVNPPFTSTTEA